MANADTLQVNVWQAVFADDDVLPVTRFRISPDAQQTLAEWSREQSGRTENQPTSVILRGLSEIAAWYAPEVAFLRLERDPGQAGQRLSFYFVDDVTGDAGLRQRMRMALQMWVNTLYPDKDAALRMRVAESAAAADGWTLFEVGCALRSGDGACPSAVDALYWDAIAADAAKRLAGQALKFRSGDNRVLVAKTAQSSAYEGLELVAFPPKRGEGQGFWSEVVTVHTATFPERGRVHVLARPSIRNWGPVTRWASARDPRRSLDIFLPADEAFGRTGRRHTSFDFQARRGPAPADGGRPGVEARWRHKDNHRVFDLLRRLTNQSSLAPEEVAAPVVDQDGLWVLPRLGTIHQDKSLPGGMGTAWPDRKDIGDSLDSALQGAGFERAEPLTRQRTQKKLEKTFAKGETASARKAVRDALATNGQGDAPLTLFVFHLRDATPDRVVKLVAEKFGEPDRRDDGALHWADGLTIRVRGVPAGVLSERLTLPELTPEESEGRNEKQLTALQGLKREEARERVVARMAEHIAAAWDSETGVGCAILEMPQALLDDWRTDPFQLARRELARHGLLPQVVLVDTRAESVPPPPPRPAQAGTPPKPKDEEKYAAAIRDCFRMLGALPLELMPEDLSPAALTIVQRNADRVGLGSRESQAIPLATRVRQGQLDCAVPDETGSPVWSPYAQAALRIYRGDYGKFGRGRQAENLARFAAFFAAVLEDIDRAGPALILAEGETLRHKVDALKNSELSFDRLKLETTAFTPADLPNVRIVRVSPDPDRQPFYYHEIENKWPSGLFGWGEARRTFYALKAKPVSVSNQQSFASMASRHAAYGENEHPPQVDVSRVSAQIDEVCVIFQQPDDEPLALATLTHRLRGAHVQTQVDTSSPFPLHELRMLAGGITF